jgi:chemotaxis protein MotC
MKKAAGWGLLFLAASLASSPAQAADPSASISDMVSGLQQLQARIATGDKAAYAAQKDQLKTIGQAIAQASPEVWKSGRDRIAATIYVLSGGQPADVVKLVQSESLPKEEAYLLRGSIAYVLGRETEALALLDKVDPRNLDLRLAGQMAFALAILQSRHDERRAMALLDLARLLSPGSLVEEAALRRQILLAGARRDVDRVAMLARQYISRFGRSFYADDFLQSLTTNLVDLNIVDDPQKLERMQTIARALTPASRLAFLLSISRAELIQGQLPVAAAAAEAALNETSPGGGDEARARFYRAAVQGFVGPYDAGVAALRAVDASKLAPNDKALFAAISDLVAHLHDAPNIAKTGSPAAPTPAPAPDDKIVEIISRAETILERTAALSVQKINP